MKKFNNAATAAKNLTVSIAMIVGVGGIAPYAMAQQAESHLERIQKTQELRVCEWPGYYGISFKDPKTNELQGIDIDMAHELGKELGVKVTFVPSSFATFAPDLLTDKCDIGMFGLGATLSRAKAVEFSQPYLKTGVYGVTYKGGRIDNWDDVDQEGVKVGVSMGSYLEDFFKGYLKKATLVVIQPPSSREAELAARRIDIVMTDYPAAHKFQTEFDWALSVSPEEALIMTPMAYAVAPGDQRWLNYVNLFIDTLRNDGRLVKLAEKNGMGPIVVK